MNERIRELANRAHLVADSTYARAPDSVWEREYNKKFVELIVKECIGVAVEQKKWVQNQQATFNYDDDLWDRARNQQSDRIIGKIREHFGIEE